MWYARTYCVISVEQALDWGLTLYTRVNGDSINAYGCRAIWRDTKGRFYRVSKV